MDGTAARESPASKHGDRSSSRLTGDLGPLQGLTQLTHLNLRGCNLTGDLGPLQGLTQLEYLNLDYCRGLTGDLGPLQGRTQPQGEARPGTSYK